MRLTLEIEGYIDEILSTVTIKCWDADCNYLRTLFLILVAGNSEVGIQPLIQLKVNDHQLTLLKINC